MARNSTASTSADRVNYFETLSATDENYEFAIDLEGDQLRQQLPQRRTFKF